MKQARQQIPEPIITKPAEAPPPPEPRVKYTDTGVELVYPQIVLRHSIFIARSHATNTDKVNPKRAAIVGDFLVIDELDLILPLAGVLLIRTREPIPQAKTE